MLTGGGAAKAKSAALKAVPGGTVDRVETDADGTKVTVKFDRDFAVTAIQDGMGSHR